MRKLASIQKIISLRPIENADKIEVAQVLGWEVIVKKGEFKVDDFVVYVEVDSLLPDSNPEFEFMRKRNFKVKTIKLRGQVSQGIIFPISILNVVNPINKLKPGPLSLEDVKDWNIEGTDVTSFLDIKNFTEEIEIKDPHQKQVARWWLTILYNYSFTRPLAKYITQHFLKAKKFNWPEFIPKTDEERIQNCPEFVYHLMTNNYYITEKLDGQSATYFCVGSKWRRKFGVCSRNMCLPKKRCNWWDYAIKANLERKMKDLKFDLYIQGELCGPGIQGNKYRLSELTLFLFNAYNLSTKQFMNIYQVGELLGLKVVPLIGKKTYMSDSEKITVNDLVEFSKDKSALNVEIHREGVVFRLLNPKQKQSVKVINPDFLLKYDL